MEGVVWGWGKTVYEVHKIVLLSVDVTVSLIL